MDSRQQVDLLGKVAKELPTWKTGEGFSIRRLIAETLQNSRFDDKGVGCEQEMALTKCVGQACVPPLSEPEKVESYCKTKTAQELEHILQTAVRFAH